MFLQLKVVIPKEARMLPQGTKHRASVTLCDTLRTVKESVYSVWGGHLVASTLLEQPGETEAESALALSLLLPEHPALSRYVTQCAAPG